MDTLIPCDRCKTSPVTTHQEYRYDGDHDHWPNQTTDRCDRCAQDLRDYAALSQISLSIIVDERI
jgi:hypothetical protein